MNGRNSDNTLITDASDGPRIPLREGMEKTYRWIYDEMINPRTAHGARAVAVDQLTESTSR